MTDKPERQFEIRLTIEELKLLQILTLCVTDAVVAETAKKMFQLRGTADKIQSHRVFFDNMQLNFGFHVNLNEVIELAEEEGMKEVGVVFSENFYSFMKKAVNTTWLGQVEDESSFWKTLADRHMKLEEIPDAIKRYQVIVFQVDNARVVDPNATATPTETPKEEADDIPVNVPVPSGFQ